MNLLRIALQGVFGFRLRTVLAIVALTSGVVGIVIVSAASSTVQSTVVQRAILINGPATTVEVSGSSGAPGLGSSTTFAAQLDDALGQGTKVARVGQLESTLVQYGELLTAIPVNFADISLRNIRPFPVVEGRWLVESKRAPVFLDVVINEATARSLGASLGDTLGVMSLGSLDVLQTRIVGIVDDGSTSESAYVALDSAEEFLYLHAETLRLKFLVSGMSVDESQVRAMISTWSQRYPTATVFEARRVDTVESLRAEVQATRSAFSTVGLIGLLASISAIANIGLSTLRERASELSLRRALGARRWHLPVIMILESQLVALAAGALSIPLSWLLFPLVIVQFSAPLGVQPPAFPWQFAGLGLGIGMLTSLLGSLAPAARALNVRISNVMRE